MASLASSLQPSCDRPRAQAISMDETSPIDHFHLHDTQHNGGREKDEQVSARHGEYLAQEALTHVCGSSVMDGLLRFSPLWRFPPRPNVAGSRNCRRNSHCACARSSSSLREHSATRVHCPEAGQFRFPPLRQDHRVSALPAENATPPQELIVPFRNHQTAAALASGVLWMPLRSWWRHWLLSRLSHT
jgi:hypothetical protein